MKAESLVLGALIFIISMSTVSGNPGDLYNISFNSEDSIVHVDIKDNDVIYFTRNGNVYRPDINSNKPVLLDSINSGISQISSSGNMISIRTVDNKLFVFNHEKKVLYKYVTHNGQFDRAIIDDKGYLAVITVKDISSPTREWLSYVYAPSGDLISENNSSSVLTSFISLGDKLVFGAANGDILIYNNASTLLWKNNVGARVKGFQHYNEDVLLASEKSLYNLSYREAPILSKILSLEDYPDILINDNSRIAVSSAEGCLYLLSNDSLQNQFSFNGEEIFKSCQKYDTINSLYILENKTLVSTDKGKVFVIEGNENKLVLSKSIQNKGQICGYVDDNEKLYIVSSDGYKLDYFNYENIISLKNEINEAKNDYSSFLNASQEENVPTFDGETLLKNIDNNYKMALSSWEAGDYTKSKEYLDEFNAGINEYLGGKETKSTNVFSIILIIAVLILAVIGILLSRRKKSGVECSNCGYMLKDYWSHCPKCGKQKWGR